MKKILITGGAGFIGSNLCHKLIKSGNHVTCLDNLYTGSKENIKDLLNHPNFKFIEHDVVFSYDIEADEIYNLACPASPPHYQKDPIKTAKTSIFGILNALECAKKYNSKILQASTSEVYGNPYMHPQKEEYFGNVNPIGIRSCYDEGKRVAETFMFDYYRKYQTKIRVVRIFNTFGPNMNKEDGRVVSNFIIQALQNKDITIHGDGTQTRSFCYVDDLIMGLIKMMENNSDFIGPVNLGNTEEITVLEFAKKIIKLTNSNSKIVFKELPMDDPIKRKPDLSLAYKKLNYMPNISVDDGLLKTIEYFKKVIEG